MIKPTKEKIRKQAGFTLIELMIAITIVAIVLTAVFSSYHTQQHNQLVQTQVAEMQQNIRAAMVTMTRDIREAGSDPKFVSGAGIVTATRGRIRITRDIAGHPLRPNEGDGDVNDDLEDIIFGLDPKVDTNQDGKPDTAPVADLCQNNVNDTNTFYPIAENIEGLEFNYLDADGNPITPVPITASSDLNRISAVQISLLVRVSSEDQDKTDAVYLNKFGYTAASGASLGGKLDGYRRRLAITTINCRNLGL